MKRGRSITSGGAWADEFESQSVIDLEDRITALENASTGESPTTTLTGTPQPATPYVIAARVGKDGLIYVTVRYTSLASTLRRFWVYHKKIKRDGTYGKPLWQRITPTAANLAANSIEVELQKGLDPHRQYDLVLIEAKLTDQTSEDGGNRDTDPNPYVEATAPGVPPGASAPLASIPALSGQPGNKVDNYCQNAKFKWGSASWTDINGTDDSGLADTFCAKWRYAVDNTRGLSTVIANGNYWSTTGTFAGQLTMTSADPLYDPSSKMLHGPYSPGEPFNVAFTALMGGQWSSAELLNFLNISLYDEGTGLTVATTSLQIGQYISRGEWRYIQMPLTTCSTSWAPIAGGANNHQWVRWHFTLSLSAGHSLHIDKVLYSNQQGAWSPNPSDLSQINPPTVARPIASGTVGQGDQPGTFDPGVGGFYIQPAE